MHNFEKRTPKTHSIVSKNINIPDSAQKKFLFRSNPKNKQKTQKN